MAYLYRKKRSPFW